MGRLEEIEARVSEVEKGPWHLEEHGDGSGYMFWTIATRANVITVLDGWFSHEETKAIGKFMACAREDVPWLLERIAKMKKTLCGIASIPCEHQILKAKTCGMCFPCVCRKTLACLRLDNSDNDMISEQEKSDG